MNARVYYSTLDDMMLWIPELEIVLDVDQSETMIKNQSVEPYRYGSDFSEWKTKDIVLILEMVEKYKQYIKIRKKYHEIQNEMDTLKSEFYNHFVRTAQTENFSNM